MKKLNVMVVGLVVTILTACASVPLNQEDQVLASKLKQTPCDQTTLINTLNTHATKPGEYTVQRQLEIDTHGFVSTTGYRVWHGDIAVTSCFGYK